MAKAKKKRKIYLKIILAAVGIYFVLNLFAISVFYRDYFSGQIAPKFAETPCACQCPSGYEPRLNKCFTNYDGTCGGSCTCGNIGTDLVTCFFFPFSLFCKITEDGQCTDAGSFGACNDNSDCNGAMGCLPGAPKGAYACCLNGACACCPP